MDYKNMGFQYHRTNLNYISYYRDGEWDDGILRKEDTVTISCFSTALHYGQQVFEGLKAYKRKDGKVQLFRPQDNAERFHQSCDRLLIPRLTTEKFLDAIIQVVKANLEFVPPYGSNATLYLRPYVIGVGENLGVRPAKEYIFGVISSPVGSYFKGGLSPVDFMVTEYDRAAPNGTGKQKVGGNYAASLYPNHVAHVNGFADCIYLDPLTHTKIDEVGAANFFGITKDGKFITPKSSSILESITKKSLMYIAKEYMGMQVEERDCLISKLEEFQEAGACGTAAVITPIGSINYQGKSHIFYSRTEVGPYTKQLYDFLIKIQYGDFEGPKDWTIIID